MTEQQKTRKPEAEKNKTVSEKESTNGFHYGRARRSEWWKCMFTVGLVCFFVTVIIIYCSGNSFSPQGHSDWMRRRYTLYFIMSAIAALLRLPTEILRCQDLGWSRDVAILLAVGSCIPYVGWIVLGVSGIIYGFIDGQPFTNQYGPDPKGRNIKPAISAQETANETFKPVEPTPFQPSMVDQLRELKGLLDDGILTQDEFSTQKAKVLSGDTQIVARENNVQVKETTSKDGDKHNLSFSDSGLQIVAIPGGSFSVGKYPVTQEIWEKVMRNNPSHFIGADLPVENVSWNDCQKFLVRLNASSSCSGQVYRLPTQEEWEYACRAGATGDYCKNEEGLEITTDTVGEVAWFDMNSEGKTHPVGKKKSNAFGLYDMLGNVSEWTSTRRPFKRVICGGGFGTQKCSLQISDATDPNTRDKALGFRLARDNGKGGVENPTPTGGAEYVH